MRETYEAPDMLVIQAEILTLEFAEGSQEGDAKDFGEWM